MELPSNIVSVGLLAVFLTFASWVLLYYPIIPTPVKSYTGKIADQSDINSTKSAFNVSLDVQQQSDANQKVRDDGKIDQPLSESTSKNTTTESSSKSSLEDQKDRDVDGKIDQQLSENTSKNTTTESSSKSSVEVADQKARDDELQQENERAEDESKIDQPLLESTSKNNTADSSSKSSLEECDLFHGEWYYEESIPLYTNKSCPLNFKQNCQGNGRPDKGYESWRWKPSQCVLPKFDANKFLELMSGKTLAFFGDSVSRNQMLSLVCILWQVEVPENRGYGQIVRWYFKSKSVTIVRIWSSWLVNQTVSAFKDIPEGIPKVFLDIPHETLMEHAPEFDVIIVSSGHWFTTKSVYVNKNKVVGGQLWDPPNGHKLHVNNVEAYRIALDTSITALAMHPKYTGLTILRSYSPDHYGGGAWNTGGSCAGKVEPVRPDQLVENKFTNVMYNKEITGFNRAVKKRTNRSKLRLMDITKAFSYRHDGHPGPYWSSDPNKIMKPDPNGRPQPEDCVHWCLPGPIDTWNEFLLEIIRREFEKL